MSPGSPIPRFSRSCGRQQRFFQNIHVESTEVRSFLGDLAKSQDVLGHHNDVAMTYPFALQSCEGCYLAGSLRCGWHSSCRQAGTRPCRGRADAAQALARFKLTPPSLGKFARWRPSGLRRRGRTCSWGMGSSKRYNGLSRSQRPAPIWCLTLPDH